MVRRTRAAALATREALIDAAERVFRRGGVSRTSLAQIAAEAGVTRGAIYWHFRDKSELLDAMCSRTMLPVDAALARRGEAASADPLGTVRSLALDALTQLATDPRTQAVFEVLFHKCELVDELADRGKGQQRCLASLEGLFGLAIAKGQLAQETDARLVTHTMSAFMSGIMREWVLDPAAYDLRECAPAMIDTFIAGLKARPLTACRPLAGSADAGAASTQPA